MNDAIERAREWMSMHGVMVPQEMRDLLARAEAPEARIEALERFVRAHDIVEDRVAAFDPHHAAVKELLVSRKALDWIAPPARSEEER